MSQTPVANKKKEKKVNPEDQREIYLAGGCFWGVEEYFSRVPGVINAESGYANGKGIPPSMNWSSKQGMLKRYTSPIMSEGFSERIASTLFPDYWSNIKKTVREMIRVVNIGQEFIILMKQICQP